LADSLPPPVERKAVQLGFRHQVGSRPLKVTSWLDFRVAGPDGAEHTGAATAQTKLTEATEAVDAQELASVHLQYRAYNVKLRGDNQDVLDLPHLQQARQNIKNLAANLRIDRQGNVVGNEVDLSRVPATAQHILASIHQELERALESMAVALPNRQVSPGDSWEAERLLHIPTLDRSIPAHLDMTYVYAGTRLRAGREEAVLDLKGKIRGLENHAGRSIGHADGVAGVDLASGQVTQTDMVVDFDVEMNQASRLLPSHGKLTLQLRRGDADN
jgi:hypothetical protein